MSRQEDFEKAALEYADSPNETQRIIEQVGFEMGCEHGYQYAIDKACEWLDSYFEDGYDLCNDFRKAMEE